MDNWQKKAMNIKQEPVEYHDTTVYPVLPVDTTIIREEPVEETDEQYQYQQYRLEGDTMEQYMTFREEMESTNEEEYYQEIITEVDLFRPEQVEPISEELEDASRTRGNRASTADTMEQYMAFKEEVESTDEEEYCQEMNTEVELFWPEQAEPVCEELEGAIQLPFVAPQQEHRGARASRTRGNKASRTRGTRASRTRGISASRTRSSNRSKRAMPFRRSKCKRLN